MLLVRIMDLPTTQLPTPFMTSFIIEVVVRPHAQVPARSPQPTLTAPVSHQEPRELQAAQVKWQSPGLDREDAPTRGGPRLGHLWLPRIIDTSVPSALRRFEQNTTGKGMKSLFTFPLKGGYVRQMVLGSSPKQPVKAPALSVVKPTQAMHTSSATIHHSVENEHSVARIISNSIFVLSIVPV